MSIVKKQKLDAEEMDQISGGLEDNYSVSAVIYDVVDDNTGKVVRSFYNDFGSAADYAISNGLSTQFIQDDALNKLRTRK